ncbi:hypothetical protein PENSPDRAFT_669063 [Peniophora sp. CONT]|nr:hypothetical protein PENSPDRAFT_669063 [Peniophora sp. CONT]
MEGVDSDAILQLVAGDTGIDLPIPDGEQLGAESDGSGSGSSTNTVAMLRQLQTQIEDGALDGDAQTEVAISVVFHPGALLDALASDMTIESADGVFFSVHSHRLLAASTNGFASLIYPPTPNDQLETRHLHLPLSGSVLNILLHAVYGISLQHFRPPIEDVDAAFNAMETCGMPSKVNALPGTPLFSLVLALAPAHGLECFELAASRDLEPLAIAVSPYLLSLSLADLTDATALRVGPTYLRRLFFLHLGRIEALKRILHPHPGSHLPTLECGIFDQRRLQNAWVLAVGSLTWEPKAGLSPGAIDSALRPLGEHLTCDECRHLLNERIRDVLVQWSLVKHTI